MIKYVKTALVASAILFSSNSLASLIFAEDFESRPGTLLAEGWTDSDGGGLEWYNRASRGMFGTYDHDNNPNTPEIPIVGALEINDDAGNVSLWSASFFMDQTVYSWERGILSYFAGERNGRSAGATVQVFNVTQDVSLTGLLTPTFNGGNWQYNEFDFLWGTTQQGDELQIRWTGGGINSADGQQITDVSLTKVSAPATLGLFGLSLMALAGVRRLRK